MPEHQFREIQRGKKKKKKLQLKIPQIFISFVKSGEVVSH